MAGALCANASKPAFADQVPRDGAVTPGERNSRSPVRKRSISVRGRSDRVGLDHGTTIGHDSVSRVAGNEISVVRCRAPDRDADVGTGRVGFRIDPGAGIRQGDRPRDVRADPIPDHVKTGQPGERHTTEAVSRDQVARRRIRRFDADRRVSVRDLDAPAGVAGRRTDNIRRCGSEPIGTDPVAREQGERVRDSHARAAIAGDQVSTPGAARLVTGPSDDDDLVDDEDPGGRVADRLPPEGHTQVAALDRDRLRACGHEDLAPREVPDRESANDGAIRPDDVEAVLLTAQLGAVDLHDGRRVGIAPVVPGRRVPIDRQLFEDGRQLTRWLDDRESTRRRRKRRKVDHVGAGRGIGLLDRGPQRAFVSRDAQPDVNLQTGPTDAILVIEVTPVAHRVDAERGGRCGTRPSEAEQAAHQGDRADHPQPPPQGRIIRLLIVLLVLSSTRGKRLGISTKGSSHRPFLLIGRLDSLDGTRSRETAHARAASAERNHRRHALLAH